MCLRCVACYTCKQQMSLKTLSIKAHFHIHDVRLNMFFMAAGRGVVMRLVGAETFL